MREPIPRKVKQNRSVGDTEPLGQDKKKRQHQDISTGVSDNDDQPSSDDGDSEIIVVETAKHSKRRKLTAQDKEDRAERSIRRTKVQLLEAERKKKAKISILGDKVQALQQQLEDLKKGKDNIETELQRCQSINLHLTHEAYQKAEKDKQYFDPDDVVREDFHAMFDAVSRFSKYQAASMQDDKVDKVAEIFEQLCSEYDTSMLASERLRMAVRKGRVPPRVILETGINLILINEVFEKPFQFLEQQEHGRIRFEFLQRLLSMAERKDPGQGYTSTRVHMMAILAPPDHKLVKPDDIGRNTEMAGLRSKHSLAITRQILTQFSGLPNGILKPLGDREIKIESKLADIVSKAVDHSCRLAVQHSNIKFLYLNQMDSLKYNKGHPDFYRHRACKFDEHDEENEKIQSELAGQPLDMVTQPQVLRIGDGTAGVEGPARVLVKAVVWMVKDEDIAPN